MPGSLGVVGRASRHGQVGIDDVPELGLSTATCANDHRAGSNGTRADCTCQEYLQLQGKYVLLLCVVGSAAVAGPLVDTDFEGDSTIPSRQTTAARTT